MAWPEFRKTKGGIARRKNPNTGEWENGSWYCCGRYPDREPICETVGLWANYKKVRKEVEAMENGTSSGGTSESLGTIYEEYKAFKSGKPDTWGAYEWALKKLLDFLGRDRQMKSIGSNDMLKFRAKIMTMPAKTASKKHCINGVIDILKDVRTFFSYCVDCKHLDTNPAQGIIKGLDEMEVATFLMDNQIRHIFDCIHNPDIVEIKKNHAASQAEFEDIVKTVLLTGMRQAEVSAFRIEHIRDSKIYVTGKGRGAGKVRTIPVNKHLIPILEKYIDIPRRILVFEGWNKRRIKTQWQRLYKRAKMADTNMPKRCRFHDLRHTFASNYMRGGGTLADLKLILGHSNIKTTIRYVHFQPDDLGPKMDRLKADFLTPAAINLRVA